jgi:methyl-accepting chemotaxis protein
MANAATRMLRSSRRKTVDRRLTDLLIPLAAREDFEGSEGIEALAELIEGLGFRAGRFWYRDGESQTVGLTRSVNYAGSEAPEAGGLLAPPWVENAFTVGRIDVIEVPTGGSAPAEAAQLAREGFDTITLLPAEVDGQVQTVLELLGHQDDEPATTCIEDLELVAAVGRAVVGRLTFAERYRTLKADRDALQHFAMAVSGAQNEDQAMQTVLQQAVEGLGWDYAVFWFRDPELGMLSYAADYGAIDMGLQMACMMGPQMPGVGLSGRVLAAGEAEVVRDLSTIEDDRFGFVEPGAIAVAAATPIQDDGNCLGVLELGLLTGTYSRERQEILTRLGAMVARLLSRVQQLVESTKLTSMVESAAAPMLFVAPTYEIVYQNPAAGKLFDRIAPDVGWEHGDLTGELLDKVGGQVGFARSLLDEDDDLEDVTCQLEDHYLHMDTRPIHAPDGSRLGYLVTLEDLTETMALRKKEALAREEAQRLAREEQRRQRELAEEQAKRAAEARERAAAERARAESLDRQARQILDVVEAAARGDLTRHVPSDLDDEVIERLAAGVEALLDSLRGGIAAMREQSDALARASSDVAGVSTQLRTNAREADSACERAEGMTRQVDGRMADVVEVIGQVEASIQGLEGGVRKACEATDQAVSTVGAGREQARRLADSADQIGGMVGVIRRIAAQTKLLALNASIEAARAGSAGKGFGVVATEVKSLAREVEDATTRIARHVQGMRETTDTVVEAFGSVDTVVSDLHGIASLVHERTSEQSELTERIQDAVLDASQAAVEVVDTVRSLRAQTRETTGASEMMGQRADDLSSVSEGLSEVVTRYRVA